MAIQRRGNGFLGITGMHRDLDDIFASLVNDSSSRDDSLPVMDVYNEGDQALVAELQLPGFSPEDVEIRVTDNVLEVRGQRREEMEDEQDRSYLLRQSVSSFVRTIVLPEHLDRNNVEANFEDGILRIRVPFKERANSQTVTVNTNKTSGKKDTKNSDKDK